MEREYWTGVAINELKENEVFVFGSNPEARHFAGAAKSALKFGAIPRSGKTNGIARGLSPNKQTYGVITKNLTAGITVDGILYDKEGYLSVSPEQISANIDELYVCAKEHADKRFLITYKYESWPNGSPKKSLNGYTSQEMLEMFVKDKEIPPNIIFHESYKPHIQKLHNNKFSENQSKDSLNNNFNNQKLKKIPNELKNLYPSVFKISGLTFISVEQFLVYSKAKYFGEIEIARITMIINDEPFIKKLINGDITPKDIEANKEYYNEWVNIMKTIKSLNEEIKINNDLSWTENLQHLLPLAIKEKILQSTDNQNILKDYINTLSVEDIEDSKINKILIEIFENLQKKYISKKI